MSLDPWLQDSSNSFCTAFHAHPWLKELQGAKVDTSVCMLLVNMPLSIKGPALEPGGKAKGITSPFLSM